MTAKTTKRIIEVDMDAKLVHVEYYGPCHHGRIPRIEIDGIVINKNTGTFKRFIRRMRKVKLIDSEKVSLPIQAFDSENQPTGYENPQLASSNSDAITIQLDENGVLWAITGSPGIARVDGSIDARIGEGVNTIPIDPIDFEVVAGEAVSAKIIPGTPVPK